MEQISTYSRIVRQLCGQSHCDQFSDNCRLAVQIYAGNNIRFLWVLDHTGIPERADELARAGSASSQIGAEPALPLSKCIIKRPM